MKKKNKTLMSFNEFRASLNDNNKNKTFSQDELQILVPSIMSIKELEVALYDEFKKVFYKEHEEIQNSIIENENVLSKQELEIKNQAEKLQRYKDDLERIRVTEAYIKRNSISNKQTEDRYHDGKLKPLSESEQNELHNTDTNNQLLGVEELAVKQYINSPRLIDYIKLEVGRGATLLESLQNNRVDLYTQNLITRGIESLLKGNDLVKYDSSHLI